jgi:predicted phage terminase large subunit-like protein
MQAPETSARQKFSPRSLLRELLARKEAQTNLARFIDYRDAGIVPARHHRLLIEHLEAVERGEIERLMVCMPPGSAKSTYTSVEFPAWFMGRNPKLSVIAASHTQELAERFGRRVRNVAASDEFRRVFDFGVSADSASAGRWDNERGGEYFAAGVGGSITGRRADLAVIDDPVKSREDADSERSRAKAWDWYTNDLLTRLKPGARQIVVMTRWHEDDLGGRILERERNRWTVLEIAMEAMPGDPLGRAVGERLWPEWFTDDMVAVAKMDTRAWNALYQQQPAADEGDYFKREWFETEFSSVPDGLRVYAASDYGVTDGAGDYTEHGVFGLDQAQNVYVLDWWRGQASADVWIERMCDMIHTHEPLCWFGEAGPIRRAIEPFLKKRMVERQAACRIEWLPSISDKPTRARSFQALASMGRVYWPKHAEWKSDVVGQLLRFPAGKHDDAVDVCSLLGRGLQFIGTKKKPTLQPPAPTVWAG